MASCKSEKDECLTNELEIIYQNIHQKYRHLLFSKFDQGIQLPDTEAWFDVTVEETAIQHAQRFRGCKTVVDAFGGCAGNSIQLAMVVEKVYYCEVDPKRIEAARNNARIYGVEDKIEFLHGSFLDLAPTLKADGVFLSPPWFDGMKNYIEICKEFDLNKMKPIDAKTLFQAARLISNNLAFFISPFTKFHQLQELARPGEIVEIENDFYLELGRVALF